MLSEYINFSLLHTKLGFRLMTIHESDGRVNERWIKPAVAQMFLERCYSWFSRGHIPELSIQVVGEDLDVSGYIYQTNEDGELR